MATTTRPYSETDGSIAFASSINQVIDILYSSINLLNSQNLTASAVGSTQLENSAVIETKIDNTVALFFQEVFS